MKNSFNTRSKLRVKDRQYEIFCLGKLSQQGWDIARLPYSLRILLENLLRREDNVSVRGEDIEALAKWQPQNPPNREIAYAPARIILQDFTGVPAIVDLAAMRDAMAKLGGDPKKINPLQPVELVIDHSIQVDAFASKEAFQRNVELDYQRNTERYSFLHWGQQAFSNFKVVPPHAGIVHQVNLEYLSRVVCASDEEGQTYDGLPVAYPDTCIGTDSHTPMVNGLGVLAWGVGGIEAEAAMLGQPISMLIPEVIGFKLEGALVEGRTATDLVLTITEMLRQKGVVGKFVEFYGPGLTSLSLADRATIGNMAPEYGATCAIFPPDELTLQYLRFSGRSESRIALVEAYMKEQGLFYTEKSSEPLFTDTLSLALDSVEPSVSGPRRPQERVTLTKLKSNFQKILPQIKPSTKSEKSKSPAISDGSVVIAAITSCTNTSNPTVMIAAGLLAKKAVEHGLFRKPWVKTSLAPGSKVVTRYYDEAGLTPYLDELGFNLTGYGCTTCIGNSGPLPSEISKQIREHDLVAVSVLSGNRNFEGRINPDVRANYLMSPPLVVAFSLVGHIDWDPSSEAVGFGKDGKPVFLRDIWPSQREISQVMEKSIHSQMFKDTYTNIFAGDKHWQGLSGQSGNRYIWNEHSTYIRHPPYFHNMTKNEPQLPKEICHARVLAYLGDGVTTDHISPAGSIKSDSPAGKYLIEHQVLPPHFNSYGSRRGNHEVMLRGTFANVRIRNFLAPNTEGGFTTYFPEKKVTTIYEAAMKYQQNGVPLCILAGKEYGSGSSRDWAAKGPALLGIKFVIAESFERIHRSNLVGMGILPLQFLKGESSKTLKLTGEEYFDVLNLKEILDLPTGDGRQLTIRARSEDGTTKEFQVIVRIDTPQEILYYRNGGILSFVLRQLLEGKDCTKIASKGAKTFAEPAVHHKNLDALVEEGSKESFPASDSPAY